MAYELAHSLKITLVAGADLSALQYQAVKLNGSGLAVGIAANTDMPVGVLQNAPKAGQEAEIVVQGVSKIKASGAVAAGAVAGITATGTSASLTVGTDTTRYVLGQVLTAAAVANEIHTVLVDTAQPGRAS